MSRDGDLKLSVISRNMDLVKVGGDGVTMSQQYLPSHTFDTAPQLDVLIVPGGVGSIDFLPGTESNNVDDYVDYVRKAYFGSGDKKPLKYIISVCNGSILLIKAGILECKKATTNKDLYYKIAELAPKTQWIGKARWVSDGNVWRTSGVSAGTDGFLALLSHLYGEELVEKIVNVMEWRRAKLPEDDPFAAVFETKDIAAKQ